MSTETSVTTRNGLIVHVDGSDDSAINKFGMTIDSGLLTQVADVQLLRLNPSHYQMKKLFWLRTFKECQIKQLVGVPEAAA